jgi:hypothetical protein
MWRFNTAVGDITLDVDDKGGHHSVFGHIPVQKEKYYIIRIMKWLFGNRLLHLYIISHIKSYVPYCSIKPPHKELFPLL